METGQLEALLREDEGTTLDFKREQYPFDNATEDEKSEILKDILAFANTWRGANAYILIGVEEIKGGRSRPVGVRYHLDDAHLQQFVNAKTNRKIEFRYECATIDGVGIGVICIPLQERPSYLTKKYAKLAENAVYIRRGSSTDSARPDEVARMGEARLARRVDATPRIVMEKDFLDLIFVWPHATGLNGGPAFLARKHWQDPDPSPPTFSIQNFGQSPALDVKIIFELDDESVDFSVPEEWQAYGPSSEPSPGNVEIPLMAYRNPGGSGVLIPLYRSWTEELPSVSPGAPRTVELPQPIANQLLLRGLQRGWRRPPGGGLELTLWARITSYSVEGDRYESIFRWGVNPFSYRPARPAEVFAHCRAIPLRGRPPEPPMV